jgi:uncharacterized protein (UPF0332 family)
LTALARSRQEIEAARLLAGAGFGPQAISRAYYAAFYAAEQALATLGESRSKHSGVISTFARLVVREGGLDEEAGRLLRSLFERRNSADYDEAPASKDDAVRAVQDAERCVDSVESWLTGGKS